MIIEAHPEFSAGFANVNSIRALCAEQTIEHVAGITVKSMWMESEIIGDLNCGVSNEVLADLTPRFGARCITSRRCWLREFGAHKQFSEIWRLTLGV